MTDMVTELTRPVDRAQLDQEIEDFNLSYHVNVEEAVNLFSLRPVAGTGTAPATAQPITTATQTRPVKSTRTRPVTTAPASRTTVPARRRQADSSPPPSDDDGDDDDEDRRRGLRRRLDLLNEDAQQRARNITDTNTVTTVYEEGGGRPSVRRTFTRTSSPSPPPSPPRRGRGRGRGRARGRGRRS